MSYKLFDALRRAGNAFAGAPDPRESRGISPQLQSNLDKRAAQVRFQGFRRMQGRPGITGPFGFVAGRSAPISPPAAASWVSGKLGTPYAPELNRMTAPDPMAFATNARAPEFVGQELDLGATNIEAGRLANQGTGIDLDFRRPQLQQQLDIGQQGLTQAEAEEAQRALVRPSEVTLAEQGVTRGGLDIGALEREAAGDPSPEERRGTRGIAQRLLETQAEQAEIGPLVDALQAQVESANLQGDFDRARQLEDRIQAIREGRMGPPAPSGGGAPPISTGRTNPVLIERNAEKATSVGAAAGVLGEGGALAALEEIADEQGFPGRDTLANMEMALSSISNALSTVSDTGAPPTPRDILVTKIKTSKGYRALKQRAAGGFGRTMTGLLTPFAGPRMLTGSLKPQDAGEAKSLAQEIVNLVESPQETFGAPAI